MKPIHKKYVSRVSFSWGGCLVLFLAVQILVLGPQGRKRAGLERQLTTKRQMYEAAMTGAREETRSKWKEQIEELENKLHGFAIEAEESANLTFDISQLAKDKQAHSFSIRGKDSGFESQTPFSDCIGENRLNVDFAAGFKQFATLLNALERNRPVVFVDKFKMERSKKGESRHPVNMELSVFVLKQAGGEGAEVM
ncbi:MAG: GspMb/PilO family protein [Planctomycetota bacterium]|jgi:hypothetical protein